MNPFDGKTVRTLEQLTDAQLEVALKTATNGFEKWRRTTLAGCGAIAAKGPSIMCERIGEFAHLVTLEMEMLIAEARGEVKLGADIIDDNTRNAERFLVAPFGGIMDSGYGRELSSMGVREFVNRKPVRVASIDDPP